MLAMAHSSSFVSSTKVLTWSPTSSEVCTFVLSTDVTTDPIAWPVEQPLLHEHPHCVDT